MPLDPEKRSPWYEGSGDVHYAYLKTGKIIVISDGRIYLQTEGEGGFCSEYILIDTLPPDVTPPSG